VTVIWATFGLSIASALIPLINIEIYLGGLAGSGVGHGQLLLIAFAAGAGQTIGKIIWYELAQRSFESARVQKKFTNEKWRASYARWQDRIHGRPWYAGAIMFASASLGVPPLLVLAMVAGTLRMPRWVFIPTVLVGRLARFYLILVGVDSLFG
jgi:membrane protein YqaA with SNARE-associated domain